MSFARLLTGMALGAGAMYFFDPRLGRRRRVRVQDQLRRVSREISEGVECGVRDLRNRGQGLAHDARALVDMGMGTGGSISTRGRFKWSPGPRLVATTGATALMANCAACPTPRSMLMGALGLGLLATSMRGKSDVHIERTMEIEAPIDQVFQFFANPENYLRVSDVITQVELMGDGRFAKTMSMAGIPMRFEERFTCMEQNQRLETHSTPASLIRYFKQMSFESMGEHRTRMHLHFCYSPPGGELGNALAGMLGLDARTLLGDLLMRAKNFLETGREPHDATSHRRNGTHGRHGSNGHPGSGRTQATADRGPAAPMSDVQRFARGEQGRSPWPKSAEENAAPRVSVAAPFPPMVD